MLQAPLDSFDSPDSRQRRSAGAVAARPSIVRVAACVRELQAALRAALADVADPAQPRTMARRLDVNRGLAWRISRALAERSAGDALRALPRSKSLGVYIDACARCGAPQAAVEAARNAVAELEKSIEACGEERRSLPVLLLGAGESTEEDGTPHFDTARQQLFEGARVLWGVEVEVGFRTAFIWPAPREAGRAAELSDEDPPGATRGTIPGIIHGAIVRGTVGLSTLRPERWPIAYAQVVSGENQSQHHGERPLDPESTLELPLIRRFCEPRSIAVHSTEARGMRRFEVVPSAVGRAGRLTCVLGTALDAPYEERGAESSRRGGPPSGALMMIIESPIRRLIIDLLVHRDLELVRPSEVTFCDRLTRPHGYHLAHVASERLPLDGAPVELGRGAAAMATSHVPWYPELVRSVAAQIGSVDHEFVGYRFECSHPPIASAALLHFWARRRVAS